MYIVKTIVAIFFISGLLVFFQNCSVQQGSGLLGSKESMATVADKIAVNAPFAYDLAVDTISYNSCVGESLNDAGLPGLKVGVNEGFSDSLGKGSVSAGLKLRTEFLQYIGTNIKPSYPSTVITPAQIQSVLSQSTANKNVFVQFAIRKKGDLSLVLDLINPTASSAAAMPRDGLVINASLSQDPVLTNLTKNIQFNEKGLVLSEGPRIYNLQSSSSPAAIEANFGFSNIVDETYAKQGLAGDNENFGIGERYSEVVRNRFSTGAPSLNDQYILTQTFGVATGNDYGLSAPKRSDETVKGQAYGRAFALKFGIPYPAVANGWKNTALKAVTETDLATGASATSNWNCQSYVIMKMNEWNNTKYNKPSCAPLIASDLANATVATTVKNLRRHYLESEWNIGLFYGPSVAYNPATRLTAPVFCLVPQKVDCYLETNNTVVLGTDVGVNYNQLSECYLYNRYGVTYSGTLDSVKAAGRCAQFASICERSNSF
ncbi:MAG: hypothetical protein WA160_16560 [Pseudobdellovibrio sp.]